MTDPGTWSKAAQAKVAADGFVLASVSATPAQEFSAEQADKVTGAANVRLTTGEEADADPLIERRG
jgi:hypothetical protein